MAFPTSRALPPPIAITPSQDLFLNTSTPSSTFSPIGFPEKFEKTFNSLSFFLVSDIIFIIKGKFTRSLSVTN